MPTTIIQKVDVLGRREASTVATATLRKLFASGYTSSAGYTGSAPDPSIRQSVSFANCDTGATIYVRLLNVGMPVPTVSSTDFDFAVAPGATVSLQVGLGIDIYIYQASGGTISYTALEVI